MDRYQRIPKQQCVVLIKTKIIGVLKIPRCKEFAQVTFKSSFPTVCSGIW